MSKGQASPLVIERASTQDGTLKVSNDGNTLIATSTGSDIGGDYTTTERFTYEKPATTGMIARHLIGYSGGSVKNSVTLKKVLNIEFVPLTESIPNIGYSEVKLDCPLGLPTVTKPLR